MQTLRGLFRSEVKKLSPARVLYPAWCPVCKKESTDDIHSPFCAACWHEIKRYDGPACQVCAEPLVSGHATTCGNCLAEKPWYERAFFYGLYEGVLKEAVHAMKFGKLMRLARLLGEMASELPLPLVDAVAAVPLTKRALLDRGFNQSLLLARYICGNTGAPLYPHALRKLRETGPQAMLGRKERLKNLRRAFGADASVDDKTVLLVDDVMTTGSTMNECARALKKAGAKEVYAVAVARAK